MNVRALLGGLLLVLPMPGVAGARASAAILPLASSADPGATTFDLAIGRALAERGLRDVLGPPELQARLTSTAPVGQALDRARLQIERAEAGALRMDRAGGISAANAGLRELEGVGGPIVARELVARAQLARALSLLLQPADPAAAQSALRAACVADPRFRPDERRLAPRVLDLLRRARRAPREVTPPSRATLARVARLGGIDRLVWIGARPGPGRQAGQLALEVRVYDARGSALATVRGKASASERVETAAGLVAQALGPAQVASAGAQRVTVAPAPAAPRPATPATRPWYERWWVWTAVGVALTGAGVGITLALTRDGGNGGPTAPQGFDFHFDLP